MSLRRSTLLTLLVMSSALNCLTGSVLVAVAALVFHQLDWEEAPGRDTAEKSKAVVVVGAMTTASFFRAASQ